MASKRRPEPIRAPQRRPLARASASPAETEVGFATAAASVVVGRLLVGSTPTSPLVDFTNNGAGPLRARTTVALDAAIIDRAVLSAQGVVLVFENGDPRHPIVTGLLCTGRPATPLQELLISTRAAPGAGRPAGVPLEARLDGERVVLEGKKEVVLKCGQASITLRQDGKVLLRGAYVETHAKGVNRIKGGSVKIN